MPLLDATLRYDCLRITLPELAADPQTAQQLDAELQQVLSKSPGCKFLIVDLCRPRQEEPQVASLLLRWQKLAASTGRRFRLNGLSDLVHSVTQMMRRNSEGTSEPRVLVG